MATQYRSNMGHVTGQGLGPFLVLSDSTLQFMLRESSYGAYPLFNGYVLSCPGAALNISAKAVPSILELLPWQFGLLMGHRSFKAAYQSQQVATMLEAHLDMPLNLRFIPLSRSLLPDRQKELRLPY